MINLLNKYCFGFDKAGPTSCSFLLVCPLYLLGLCSASLENQSGQSSHSISVSLSSLSGDVDLTGTFGSTSRKGTPGYTSGPRNLGQLDVTSEAIETTSASLLSSSSISIAAGAALYQQTTENDSLNASFPSTTLAPELHSVETTETLATDLEDIKERITTIKKGLITSVKAGYVPARYHWHFDNG